MKQKRGLLWKKEHWPRLKKLMNRLREPTVDGVCVKGDLELDEDTVH